jgi:GcrA cell cycle regulator
MAGAPLGNRNNGEGWPAEHIEALKLHYAAELSASQIAAEIGREFNARYSRNAIIGKVHRLGLTRAHQPPHSTDCLPRKKRHQPYKARPKRLAKTGNASFAMVDTPIFSRHEQSQLRCVEVVPLNVRLLDLNPNDCRYPYGDGPFTFCGHPAIEGNAYCLSHLALCTGWGTPSERSAWRI